jgi:hypothetical protein
MRSDSLYQKTKQIMLGNDKMNSDFKPLADFINSVTFYLYTDKQVKLYENSPLKKEWADKYFDILKNYDEFGYFKRDTFDIYLDSNKNV